MLLRRGMLFLFCLSILGAQTPSRTPKKAAPRPVTRAGTGKKPAGIKAASSNTPPATEQSPPGTTMEPEAKKLLTAIAAKHRELKAYEIEGSLDSGRQVDEAPRQLMSKADFKMRMAPDGRYFLEVIEDDNQKLPYKVYSDGTRRWVYVAESKQYEETAALPTKPLNAAEEAATGPLEGVETFAERLLRQIIPQIAQIDKNTDSAFLRGGVLTLLGKQTDGRGSLFYLRAATADGTLSQASWYRSDTEGEIRKMLRTDFKFHSFKVLDPAPDQAEFQFQPPAGAQPRQNAVAAASTEPKPESAR